MNNKCLTVIFLTIGLIHPIVSFSSDEPSLILGNFDAKSKQARVDIAKDTLNHVRALADFLPTQKMTEIEWIEKEKAEINKLNDANATSSRLIQLLRSPEINHQKLSGLLKAITDALECVASPNVNIKIEMLCWSVASFHMTDSGTLNDVILFLIDSGRLPDNIVQQAGLSDVTGIGSEYNWFGRGMQEYILIPYLKGEIN